MFVCPSTKDPLSVINVKGHLSAYKSTNGTTYEVKNGIPNFYISDRVNPWKEYYKANAETYDNYNHITFEIQGFDEYAVRNQVADLLEINKNDRILELGCGTGRDSILLAQKAKNAEGELYCADASQYMISICREKLDPKFNNITYLIANSENLPFPDNYFDHLYSFVAFTPIANKSKCLEEIARVVKPGGKVIITSEGLLNSLKKQGFGKKIINNCDLYDDIPPLDILPIEARNVNLKWILNGIIYILQFDIGEGEVSGNFDYEIEGKRGGTINSRYHGMLNGVSSETKTLFEKAVAKSNKTKYEWLNDCLNIAAKNNLE